MKKIAVTVLVIALFYPSLGSASTLECSDVDGMAIFGYDGSEWIHIGAIGNEYNSLSIANEYGAGNEYKSISIFNEFGRFGSEFGSYSALNDMASKPPVIINNDYKFVGYLTVNEYKVPNINTYEALACAKNSYRSPDREMEDITFKNVPSSSLSYEYYSSAPVSSCPINSHTSPIDPSKCLCDSGFRLNSTMDGCVPIPTCPEGYVATSNNICITYTQSCQSLNNADPNITGGREADGKINCNCRPGFIWDGQRCFENVKIEAPVPAPQLQKAVSYQKVEKNELQEQKSQEVSSTSVSTSTPSEEMVANSSQPFDESSEPSKVTTKKRWYHWFNPFSWFR